MAPSYACQTSKYSPASLFCKKPSLHVHSLCMGNRDSKQIATVISTTAAGS